MRGKSFLFIYALLALTFISKSGWSWDWTTFFERKVEKPVSLFEPSAKSCNVDFSLLETDQQQQCFNLYKNFANALIRSNPQIEGFITAKTLHIEMITTGNPVTGDGDNPAAASPPMPGIFASPPMPGIVGSPSLGYTNLNTSPSTQGLMGSPPMPGIE